MSISVGGMIAGAAATTAMQAAAQQGSSFLGALQNYYFGKKSEKNSLARQYYYAQQYALNSPSWTVQGLRNANLNPILAATDGAFSSPTVPSVSTPNLGSSGSSPDISGMLGALNSLATGEKERELMEGQTSVAKSQAFKTFVDGLTELKKGGYSGNAANLSVLAKDLGLTSGDFDSILKQFGFGGSGDNPLTKSTPDKPAKPSTSSIKSKHVPLPSEKILGHDEWERTVDYALGTSKTWRDYRREEREDRARREADFEARFGHKFKKPRVNSLPVHGVRRGRGPKRK